MPATPPHDTGLVRVTLHPATDLLLPAGRTLRDLRTDLAALSCRPEMLTEPVHVEGSALHEDHPVGTHPLLPGATLRTGTSPENRPTARWHVAVTHGVDAGRLIALDTLTSVDGLVLRRRHDIVRVLRPHGARRIRNSRRTGRRALPGGRWRVGHTLTHNGSFYELRRPSVAGPTARPLTQDHPSPSPDRKWVTFLATTAVSVLVSLAIAVTMQRPALALLALVGPLAALAPALLDRRRPAPDRPRERPRPTPRDPLSPGPADLLTWAETLLDGAATTDHGDRHDGTDPASTHDAPAGLPDRCVAVVGTREHALAVARAIVAELLVEGPGLAVVGPPGRLADWSWCRWLPGTRASGSLPDDAPRVTVADGLAAPLTPWWASGARECTHLVVVLSDHTRVPAWCRTVVDVDDPRHLGSPGPTGVSAAWGERFARRLAAAHHRGRWGTAPDDTDRCDPTAPGLPSTVSLPCLLGAPTAPERTWIEQRWTHTSTRRSLRTPLGVDSRGEVVVLDLLADGPHALVAGTTGSGKSELLQTLVTGLALTYSPRELTLALIDFKGGAGFGACADLPHVAGRVTDLDGGLAERALHGIRAELRHREHVLAHAGVTQIEDLPRGTLPRLVIVIDEFRALADDVGEGLSGLIRIAAQGRSLGVHLVLATQRPGGVVNADMRANITLRLALRVVDAVDSRDIVDSAHAAAIPSGAPGRLILVRGSAPAVAAQCALAGAPAPEHLAAQAADPWGRIHGPARAVAQDEPAHGTDVTVALRAWVRETRAAAAGTPPPRPPWLPALPDLVRPSDLRVGRFAQLGDLDASAGDGTAPGAGLPLALGDVPDEQCRIVVRWNPDDGPLAVVGRSRSGRTTALRALASAALARGWQVHALAAPEEVRHLAGHPGFGTVVGRDDPRRAARLLRLLLGRQGAEEAAHPVLCGPTLLVIDDVEDARAALMPVARGAGADLLDHMMARRVVHVAVAGTTPTLGGLAARAGARLVLSGTDRHDDLAYGLPASLAGRGGRPGRGVWLGQAPVECQVVHLDDSVLAHGSSAVDTGPTNDGPPLLRPDAARPAPIRLRSIPSRVHVDETDGVRLSTPGPGKRSRSVVVGHGGDAARPVHLDLSGGALIVGPHGSGRTTALRLLARNSRQWGPLRAVVARDDGLRSLAEFSLNRPTPDGLADLLARCTTPGAQSIVVVDDLDTLGTLCPLETETLAHLCRAGAITLLASATTYGAASALRGALADLRAARTGIVLAPGERGSDDVFGHDLGWVTDPGAPRPGRGVAVSESRLTPVQVALAE